MFIQHFDKFACHGDSISCEKDGFTITATIYRDDSSDAPDQRDEGFWPSKNPDDCGYIGENPATSYDDQMKRAKEIMEAWKDDEWFYCGIVLSVSKNGVMLEKHAASCWGIECNYPINPNETRENMPGSFPNYYLNEVANDLLSEALEVGKTTLKKLI